MEKSYVSMEQKMCPVCGKIHTHECGILLDRRMRNSMERFTTTGYGMCEEHDKMWKDGYVALVVVDAYKSGMRCVDAEGNVHESKQNLKMENAHRTGEVIHIGSEAFRNITRSDISSPMIFIDEEGAEKIKGMAKLKEENNADAKV